ncbi:MAG TPA: AzlC family ABC transporter permease [Acidimicrobiia bacterium]|nr:AzlC family ABC transporter permease [Acidimicrobiia bacterium]
MSSEVRRSALLGARHMAGLLVPTIPMALVLGVAIAESSVPNLAGWASSFLMFGGASQLTAVTLLGEGAGVAAAVLGALTVNARHVMYSAALVPHFRPQPRWFRLAGPYLLLDQVFALASTHDGRPRHWRAYYLGAGLLAWTYWQTFVGAGVLFGPAISTDFDVSFAVPALFLALLVPALVRRPAIVAASVAGVVTAVFWQIPNRGGMLIGGVAGVLAGYLTESGEEA